MLVAWVAYRAGIAQLILNGFWLQIPNGLGCLSGIAQLILYLMYRTRGCSSVNTEGQSAASSSLQKQHLMMRRWNAIDIV
jgi:hypothetical protein